MNILQGSLTALALLLVIGGLIGALSWGFRYWCSSCWSSR